MTLLPTELEEDFSPWHNCHLDTIICGWRREWGWGRIVQCTLGCSVIFVILKEVSPGIFWPLQLALWDLPPPSAYGCLYSLNVII